MSESVTGYGSCRLSIRSYGRSTGYEHKEHTNDIVVYYYISL